MPLVTPGEYTGRPADGFTLCEQLGRMWAERSAFQPTGGEIGLTFAEPSVTTERANIYACELPQREHRLDVAASITIDDDSRVAPSDPSRRFLVSVEGHAKSQREAVALLADLVRHLLNRDGVGRGWWDEPVTRHGVDLRGAVGFPTLAAGEQAAVWRILSVEQASGPRVAPQNTGTGRSAQGQAVATLSLVITAVEVEWEEPE